MMAMPSSPLIPFPPMSTHSPPVPPAHGAACPKTYTKRDMALALEALKSKKLSLSRASEVYGIPPTTLWQRANRMGIPTPKKDTTSKNWSDDDLENALNALRRKEISANKASKVYKIPSSTLYKIARKEGIELAQPFNAVATTWSQEDLNSALEAIKNGQPVQKAAAEYGIPSGTLYGRCKKVGIELSKHSSVSPTSPSASTPCSSRSTGRRRTWSLPWTPSGRATCQSTRCLLLPPPWWGIVSQPCEERGPRPDLTTIKNKW